MNCIFVVRSEIKIKFGLQGFAAAYVQITGQAMDKESEGLAYLRQNILQNT